MKGRKPDALINECCYFFRFFNFSENIIRLRVWTHRERQRERQATKLSLVARVVAWKFGCTHRLRACVRETNRYGIIYIRICCHIYCNMLSYLLEYVVISIGICCHIYWNMLSYLLEYIIIFSGNYYHIYYNMSSYLFIVI